jgi:flagellar biosynthetic protein FliR
VAAVGVSYAHLPLGGTTLLAAGARTAMDALGWAFLTALSLAAPVLAVGFLLNLLLGVLGKAMPQLGLLQTGLPAQVGVGLVALLLALPLLVAGFSGLVPITATWIGRLWP